MQAIRAGCVAQIDPLNVVARSHDLALYGRVLDYRPTDLEAALYIDRKLFDYGGTVMVHAMDELPFWRVVMSRKQNEARWVTFAQEHVASIDEVQAEIRARGPLGTRDFQGASLDKGNFRSGKVAGRALYYLWLAGYLMTHSRRGFDRAYDLRERIAPPELDYSASPGEADDFFALRVFQQAGMTSARGWRNRFSGTIERRVDKEEASARLEALLAGGKIAQITLEYDPKDPRFLLASDLPLLVALHEGKRPGEWKPLDTSTSDEMVFLAPLEIVSARGRALSLFDFEYLWEVYKPAEKRRWGYYTLPMLYQNRLVGRLDPKLDRSTGELLIKGFWLESNISIDEAFIAALARAFRRFMQFLGANSVDLGTIHPDWLRDGVRLQLQG